MIIPYDFDNVNTKRLNFVIRKSVFSLYNLRRIMYISYRKPILRTFFNTKGASVKKIHLINGTHWDREWYREFEVFRIRLLRVFDNVLNLLEQNKIPSFYFDGQVGALLDYLQIRPEKEILVKKLIKEK